MNKLGINKDKDCFIQNGKPFFYLADTIWSAFTHVDLTEWEEYLNYRKMQGFNVLQISILPISHDASESDINIQPFETDEKGVFNYKKINPVYFERARKMLDMARDKGFIPALVVLWGNVVKDTWMSDAHPENIMPLDMVKPYTEYIVKEFSRFNPIYLISGDTNFGSEQTTAYYMAAMETIKKVSPDSLTTLHICGGNTNYPEDVIESPHLDFYMYQSCHMIENQEWSYELAEQFLAKSVKRPIVNGEPCYDGHGHGGKYGRFNEFDIRKATWQSLLSGAKAGVTYGAHGVWSWHKKNKAFNNVGFSGIPFDWRTSLRLEGAWEAGFAKWIFENFELVNTNPVKLVVNDSETQRNEIRMSADKDMEKFALYVPYSTEIKLSLDLSKYDLTLITLKNRYFTKPEVKVEGNISFIKPYDFNSDAILIGKKSED
jgi:Protein of unknown function (DUF4038)